jgi:glycerol-3-phosphate dehydrogenase
VINAAGLYADEIAWMVGDHQVRLALRKGTMVIFDKSISHLVRHMIFGTFAPTHSQNIAPTAHGNLILGIRYVETDDKEDTKVSREGILETMKLGKQLVPAVSEKDIITSFSGILTTNNMARNGDFHIAPSEHVPNVIHVLVGAPGLTAAPGIAELMVKLLIEAGMETDEKKGFQKKRRGWRRFESASLTEKLEMIASNPKYGHVLCRCEQVTEAEILEAMKKGAVTLDAIKHLTRAGMGRCQGGFCGITMLKLLAQHLGIPLTEVTKNGKGSHQLTGPTKAANQFTGNEIC